jgi:hypothetical protein
MKSIYVLLFANCSKKGTHATSTRGRSSCTNLKWVWKDCEPKMFIPIASDKNGQKSNKNLEAMIRATRAQLLKYALQAMHFAKMRLNIP